MCACPQTENGYTKIANEIMEALAGIRISGEARQCLDVIIRKTYGFNKKEDYIALSQFALVTHLGKTHIIRGLRKLEQINILITQKGNESGNKYIFNKDFDTWKPLPKKVIVTQKGNASLPKKVHTKDNTTKDNIKGTPKLSKIIVDTFLKEMNLVRPDGDYLKDNIIPAREISKYITEMIVKDKKEPTNEKILSYFISILNKMDNFHFKNATNIKYIKYNFNKIINTLK